MEGGCIYQETFGKHCKTLCGQRERERERERERDRERERQRDREIEIERQIDRETKGETKKWESIQVDSEDRKAS